MGGWGTREKIKRIYNTSLMFMDEFGLYNQVGQIDLICVYLDRNIYKGHSKGHLKINSRQIRIEYFENINYN